MQRNYSVKDVVTAIIITILVAWALLGGPIILNWPR